MSERPFKEKSNEPTNEKINEALGAVSEYYHDLNKLTKDFQHTWNHSKSSGWMEKVEDNKKALYYFIPLNDSFILSMAIRENEKEYFESKEGMVKYKDIVSTARKYSEGYNIKFEVENSEQYDFSKEFVKEIIAQR